ncbi:MAG TPA: hypothetical protein VK892_16650 [Pyrinomonadaceae bacterium]|nr:hypothetical protein [Pyrinomonadaceae bacterium]
MAAETLSTLRYAGEQGGKGLEEITGGLARFSKTIGEAARGSDEAKEKLERLGIDPKKALNDLDGALAQVIKRIYELPPGVKQMTAAQDAFGRSGADLIVTINATKGDLKAFREEAERLGLVLTNEDARAADEFGDMLVQLDAQFKGIKYTIGKEFLPIFTDMAKSVSEWLIKNKSQVSDWSRDFALGLRRAADTAKGFAVELEQSKFFETMERIDEIIMKYHPVAQLGSYLRKRGQGNALKNQLKVITDAMFPPDDEKKNTGDDEEESKKEAEKRRKEREAEFKKEMSLRSQQNKILLEAERKDFEESNKQWEQQFINRNITQEKFLEESLKNVNAYNRLAKEALQKGFEIESAGKSGTELENLRLKLADDLKSVDREIKRELEGVQKTVTDSQKKTSDERLKQIKEEIQAEIELREAAIRKVIAQRELSLSQGLISEADLQRARQGLNAIFADTTKKPDFKDVKNSIFEVIEDGKVKYINVVEGLLKFRKDKLLEELQYVKAGSDEEKRIYKELALLKELAEQTYYEQRKENQEQANKSLEEEKRLKQQLIELNRELMETERKLKDFRSDQERKTLQNAVDSLGGKDRFEAIRQLADFEKTEADRKRKERIDDLNEQKRREFEFIDERAKKDVEFKKQADAEKLKLEQIYNNERLLAEEQFQATKAEIEAAHAERIRNAKSEQFGGGLFGDLMGDLAIITDPTVDAAEKQKQAIESLAGSYDFLKNVAGAAINSLISAGQDLLTQWILTGKGGAKALVQLAAATVSSIAIQAGVKAIFALAEGLMAAASFPFNPLGLQQAAMFFAAAKTYGLIAGGAALGAIGMRAAIGDSFNKEKTADSSISRDRQSDEQKRRDELKIIEINRNQSPAESRSEPRKILLESVVTIKNDAGFIIEKVKQDIYDLGDIYNGIQYVRNRD